MKIVGGVVLAAVVFVVGDWLGWFGTKIKQIPDFVHIVFVTRDAQSGDPVENVHVVCSRPMSRSVCSERLTGIPGQTEITFGVFREEMAGILFSKPRGFSLGSHGELTMTFIHPNYERHVMFVDEQVIAYQRKQKITVDLSKAPD